jgi:hypothetical protein
MTESTSECLQPTCSDGDYVMIAEKRILTSLLLPTTPLLITLSSINTSSPSSSSPLPLVIIQLIGSYWLEFDIIADEMNQQLSSLYMCYPPLPLGEYATDIDLATLTSRVSKDDVSKCYRNALSRRVYQLWLLAEQYNEHTIVERELGRGACECYHNDLHAHHSSKGVISYKLGLFQSYGLGGSIQNRENGMTHMMNAAMHHCYWPAVAFVIEYGSCMSLFAHLLSLNDTLTLIVMLW